MKTKVTLLIFTLIMALNYETGNSQSLNDLVNGGEFKFNASKTPCVTEEQRHEIQFTVRNSIERMDALGELFFSSLSNRGTNILFDWPVKKANAAIYNDVWAISGYVDHNESFPNQLTDYNCGSRTYDTPGGYNHQGVDMFTWPFGWDIMDNDLAEVIAAADGQIVFKRDGEFDRSCDFNSNPWNAVYVQHTDGSIAWYGHLKNGSVTSKNVGDMVSTGEYLGVIGSSGNSTGPHLHFEIYEDSSFANLIDPYAGPCNNMNSESRWISQRTYNNPKLNALITHTNPPQFNTCPEPETLFAEDTFNDDETIYFAMYLRDQEIGSSINLKVIRPDNSMVYNWNFPFTNTFSASYYYWVFSGVFDQIGEWKWEATYMGETVTQTFNITDALSVDDAIKNNLSVYPNPFTDELNIKSNQNITEIVVMDILGKTIITEKSNNSINSVNLGELSKGVYFMRLLSSNNKLETIKIIKK